jgi:hypothetical protein
VLNVLDLALAGMFNQHPEDMACATKPVLRRVFIESGNLACRKHLAASQLAAGNFFNLEKICYQDDSKIAAIRWHSACETKNWENRKILN